MTASAPERRGWLALIGGGEFTFGETEEADRSWLEKAAPGPVGFVPAASGSHDYATHFTAYLAARFDREVELVPIYRPRDARRGRNVERLAQCGAVYLGGGVADHLVETLAETPALAALRERIENGGVVAAIGAAAQACGASYRSLAGGRAERGLALAPEIVVEPNFDPAHDRRLRTLLAAAPPAAHGLGIPAGAAVLLGPEGGFEAVGDAFALGAAESDLVPLVGEGRAPTPG